MRNLQADPYWLARRHAIGGKGHQFGTYLVGNDNSAGYRLFIEINLSRSALKKGARSYEKQSIFKKSKIHGQV